MSQTEVTTQLPVTVVRRSRGWPTLNLRELWAYRDLLYFLAWRDIKVRYKQTVMGAGWAIVQPFLTMVVFSIFFGRLANIPSDGVPYPIFSYCGLIPWYFFAQTLNQSGQSVVSNQSLITKVYFPRLVAPTAPVLAGLVDFTIAFTILIGLMAWYGIVPTVATFTLPLFLLMAILTALAVGMWLSALNVYYRDVRFIIPFIIQFWLFATPVVYPSSMLPEQWRVYYGLNPMAGVVEGFRWALLGNAQVSEPLMAVSGAMAVVLFITGVYFFRRMERTFADVV